MLDSDISPILLWFLVWGIVKNRMEPPQSDSDVEMEKVDFCNGNKKRTFTRILCFWNHNIFWWCRLVVTSMLMMFRLFYRKVEFNVNVSLPKFLEQIKFELTKPYNSSTSVEIALSSDISL